MLASGIPTDVVLLKIGWHFSNWEIIGLRVLEEGPQTYLPQDSMKASVQARPLDDFFRGTAV